jgi:hypothetical protein
VAAEREGDGGVDVRAGDVPDRVDHDHDHEPEGRHPRKRAVDHAGGASPQFAEARTSGSNSAISFRTRSSSCGCHLTEPLGLRPATT